MPRGVPPAPCSRPPPLGLGPPRKARHGGSRGRHSLGEPALCQEEQTRPESRKAGERPGAVSDCQDVDAEVQKLHSKQAVEAVFEVPPASPQRSAQGPAALTGLLRVTRRDSRRRERRPPARRAQGARKSTSPGGKGGGRVRGENTVTPQSLPAPRASPTRGHRGAPGAAAGSPGPAPRSGAPPTPAGARSHRGSRKPPASRPPRAPRGLRAGPPRSRATKLPHEIAAGADPRPRLRPAPPAPPRAAPRSPPTWWGPRGSQAPRPPRDERPQPRAPRAKLAAAGGRLPLPGRGRDPRSAPGGDLPPPRPGSRTPAPVLDPRPRSPALTPARPLDPGQDPRPQLRPRPLTCPRRRACPPAGRPEPGVGPTVGDDRAIRAAAEPEATESEATEAAVAAPCAPAEALRAARTRPFCAADQSRAARRRWPRPVQVLGLAKAGAAGQSKGGTHHTARAVTGTAVTSDGPGVTPVPASPGRKKAARLMPPPLTHETIHVCWHIIIR
ncbi:nascent polypeptide-associated complex subunit alpha, muscle-specific form-like [Felis catus]|uniref:nascent polypeptide-associated complex subunit alpha, muscle-specific form-like n=1 Tax=Felis catus TaxID=9685 RepID=UPI001D19B0D7|nr:nascent polypeptide-associated complex subunit alpha, muscle-specific form-like [Felis catus]